VVNVEDPGHDDFELWSPAEARPEQCLFGRQVRSVLLGCLVRNVYNCVSRSNIIDVYGIRTVLLARFKKRKTFSSKIAFAQRLTSNGKRLLFPCLQITLCLFPLCSEFNHVRNANGECELVPGTTPLPNDDSCSNGEDYWYERTAYRLIPYSSCVDGYRPDRGTAHVCPGLRSKSSWFWFFMLLLPFSFTALVAYYYYRRSGLARG
jgi:hypothetical protein